MAYERKIVHKCLRVFEFEFVFECIKRPSVRTVRSGNMIYAIVVVVVDCKAPNTIGHTKLRLYTVCISLDGFFERVFLLNFIAPSMWQQRRCGWRSKLIINNIRVQWVGCIQSCLGVRFLIYIWWWPTTNCRVHSFSSEFTCTHTVN